MSNEQQGHPGTEFFTPEQETPDGWRLPLKGNFTGWMYVGLLDLAFEVWLGGDYDVTVRLQGPFRYGSGDLSNYDARTTLKSQLAPVIDMEDLKVDEFFVAKVGDLDILFSDGTRLIAGSIEDGNAWQLEWPTDQQPRIRALPGGGLERLTPTQPTGRRADDRMPRDSRSLEPVQRIGVLELPISGLVTTSSLSGMSIELAVPIPGVGTFDVHIGGGIEITDAAGNAWHGSGDEEGSSLGPVLDFVGDTVTQAYVDSEERLHMAFASGSQLTALPDTWEAHWPKAAGTFDEYWVPQEGPRIP
jgi:hypothetical protein